MTAAPRPAEAGTARPPPGGRVAGYPRRSFPRPHILVVNGRKVRHPVFILGAPRSGRQMLATAVKRSGGFHMTLGQRPVLPVVHAFARSPALARSRKEAAATVLRDAFAQAWQINPHCCLGCSADCRQAGGIAGATPCADEREVSRYGDASPNLLYCAESLVDAFSDARLVQIIRDGRDVVSGMLTDPDVLAWFQAGYVNLDAENGHPLLGVETPDDHSVWQRLSVAGKCAMRWRGTVRIMARLRASLSPEQLTTVRYEDMVRRPLDVAATVSEFVGAGVSALELGVRDPAMEPGRWRRVLAPSQAAEVEQVAGEELRRVGYGA